MTRVLLSTVALGVAVLLAPQSSGRSAESTGCVRCKARYDETTGKVLQTCPDGFSSGGLYCIIRGDECRTVGTCSP